MPIDLRSDTVTRPTTAMRAAMAAAEVGDDVYAEDPTVNALEARAAALAGKEAAIYVASGTMANELAIRLHCEPGDEALMHAAAHPFHHESGAPAAIWGVTIRPIPGGRGRMDEEALALVLHPEIRHMSRQRLLCIENTHGFSGGAVLPLDHLDRVTAVARASSLATHMDGARVFNASVASGVPVRDFAARVDTISFCLSKGLGAPVGSCLCGPADLIRRARRHRHMLGGGWRQAGILAAAGLYALDHHVERLADDHRRARSLGEAIEASGAARLLEPIETNIVLFAAPGGPAPCDALQRRLAGRGVLVSRASPVVLRAVTHMDVDDFAIEKAGAAFLS
ncbi:MAG: low-specificity L-threonine aldolase [Deltaproteobacteria bacterium]|nr:low-specificity L-threonine aldolase [Deltaproteobacteria bacterium]